MNISNKAKLYLPLLAIIVLGLLAACSSPATDLPAPKPSASESPSPPPADKPTALANRVDIVYFHPKIRCGACISVELRTKALMNDSFKDAMSNGKLTFQAYELQDKQNRSMVLKYGAVSSQLFITTVKNGVENIKHIEEVWMPQILNDGVAFDEFMRKIISQSLKEVV